MAGPCSALHCQAASLLAPRPHSSPGLQCDRVYAAALWIFNEMPIWIRTVYGCAKGDTDFNIPFINGDTGPVMHSAHVVL